MLLPDVLPRVLEEEVVDDYDELYEVVNGQRQEPPPMGAFETHIANRLSRFLSYHTWAQRLGHVEVEMLFRLDAATDLQRRPDLSFVSYERWTRGRPVPRTPSWDVAPDLAVEVVSPTNSASGILDKIGEYFRAGVLTVWVIYPVEEQIYVYESPTIVRVLTLGAELDGGAVVPGFRLPLASLFRDEDEPQLPA
jgi:Uma2 family endonuclease